MEVMVFCRSSVDSGNAKFMRNIIITLLCVLNQLLLSKGANIAAMNTRGDTPLTLAQKRGHESITHLFQNTGNGGTVLPRAQAYDTTNTTVEKYVNLFKS